MAIQVIWDQVQGSERRLAVRENGYDVRTGIVLGLSDADHQPWELLTKAVLASDSNPPYVHPDATLAALRFVLYDVIVRGASAQTATIWARYQPLSYSGVPLEQLAIEGQGGENYEMTERHPLNGKPYTVRLPADTPETSPSVVALDTADADVSVVGVGYPRELTVIVLYGLFAEVPAQLHTLSRKVNAAPWPPPGNTFSFQLTPGTSAAGAVGMEPRPTGHWRASPLSWRWSQRDGRFAVSLSLTSKGTGPGEDWSNYAFAINPTNGKKLAPDPALMTALIGQTYQNDIRCNVGGVFKVGQFDVIDYSAVLAPLLNGTFLGNSNPFGFTTT